MTVMVISTALIAGFKNEISNKIFGFWGHIHITDYSASYSLLENFNYPISNDEDFYPVVDTTGPIEYTEFPTFFGQEYPRQTMTKGGIRHIQQFAVMPGLVKSYPRDEQEDIIMEGIILKGIAEDYEWDFFNRYLVEGDALVVTPDSIARTVLISQSTANRLKSGVGDRLEFTFLQDDRRPIVRGLTVTGIFKTGLEEYDKEFALVDIKQIQNIMGWEPDQIGGFEIFLDNIDDLGPFTDYVHNDVLPGELYAESIREKMVSLFDWLDIQDYNEALILGLMTLVAIINMMTALLILILERTNMIGILKALGQNNWSIRRIFLYYAGYIVVLGLFWGNLIGLGLCWLQDTFGFVTLDEESYYLAIAPISVNWWVIILLNLGVLLITLIFLIIPSYLVTRVDPVKSIRFK
ncbi:ABC transporter permease [Lewinellaceae bacterium SD302]|nr:ABC transporter permease [Lewinellaceae bacterium SD302]